MRGDLYLDFGVALALFIFALATIFYYIDSEFNLEIKSEKEQSASIEIQNIYNSFPREKIEKREIFVEGVSTNEFVNLSNYDVDLILDENHNVVCFSPELKGFVANISNSKFFLYSTKENINKKTCDIQNFSDHLSEKISSPIYEYALLKKPKVNSSGEFCQVFPILILSDSGIKRENIKICV